MNTKGCSPNNEEQIKILLELIRNSQLDAVLLNKVNTKWTFINVGKIE